MEENNNNTSIVNELINPYQDEYIIGIDLGTTNSCVSIWRNNNIEIIPDEYGNKTIPSFVAYTNINRYIGKDAKNQKELNSENVFYEVKRLIGKKFTDPKIKLEKEYMSYKITNDENQNIRLVSGNKLYSPEEIQAGILSKLKIMASNYLKTPITKAVIAVPADFNDGQRQATKDAAIIAGLDCIRIINEPVAAALTYGLIQRKLNKKFNDITQINKYSWENNENINCPEEQNNLEDLEEIELEYKTVNFMVYDFGGGTLDVTLLSVCDGIFEVLASSGNSKLGGSDFETRMMSFAIAKFEKINNIEVFGKLTSLSIQNLRQSCENAKKILSLNNKTIIAVKNFYENKDLYLQINRIEFENLCSDLFLMCLEPIDEILKICELNVDEIQDVIMVGGMSRMPRIRQLIKYKIGKEPNCTVNPEESISCGAAIQAYIISHQMDPFSDSITLLDRTSLSLGVETIGGVMDVLIERGTIIPCENYKMYTTDEDFVEIVDIKIYEGERTMTIDNFFVGEFELRGIKSEPRGMAEINVKFEVDLNGIIIVSAENMENNNTNSISIISNKGRLTKEEINRLVNESKELELRDEFEKMKKLCHYEIEDLCSNIFINLKRSEFKLSDTDKEIIFDDVEKIKFWLVEKSYKDREDEEYENVLKKIKQRYGMLILKGNNNVNSELKDSTVLNNTTIYGNDDDEDHIDKVFEKIENEKLGICGMSDSEKIELKEIRENLFNLCYTIIDIVFSDTLNLSDEHSNDLKEYINDALLWANVHQESIKNEYKIKIDEINEQCERIFEYYQDNETDLFIKNNITKNIKNSRDELENLCIVLKLMIDDGVFSQEKTNVRKLLKYINETLDWITEKDFTYKNKNNSEEIEFYYDECNRKIEEINNECSYIDKQNNGINFDKNNDILGGNRIILTGPDSQKDENKLGTNIIDLMKKKQLNVIKEMIDEDINYSEETF
jgi:molecular chaperone DnaK (HSP70)